MKVFDGSTQIGTRPPTERGLELYDGGAAEWRAQSDGDSEDAAGNTGTKSSALAVTVDTSRRWHRASLVLARQRHGRRREHHCRAR